LSFLRERELNHKEHVKVSKETKEERKTWYVYNSSPQSTWLLPIVSSLEIFCFGTVEDLIYYNQSITITKVSFANLIILWIFYEVSNSQNHLLLII